MWNSAILQYYLNNIAHMCFKLQQDKLNESWIPALHTEKPANTTVPEHAQESHLSIGYHQLP